MSVIPRVLGVIAARGGSKGLPRKNILDVGGRPMVAWSIAAAAGARHLARTVVSTDDEEIASVARASGGEVPFLRPADLATDRASIVDAILHAVDAVDDDFTHVVLLQATSPLRSAADIDGAIELCAKQDAPSCVTVTAVEKGPEWMLEIGAAGDLKPFMAGPRPTRRQEFSRHVVQPNGAVYVAKIDWLRQTRDFYGPGTIGLLMPRERSIDVDDAHDLDVVRAIVGARNIG